jgi:hypothetical protein
MINVPKSTHCKNFFGIAKIEIPVGSIAFVCHCSNKHRPKNYNIHAYITI